MSSLLMPRHHLAGGVGEALVQGVEVAVVRLAAPLGEAVSYRRMTLDAAVGDAAVDDDVLDPGVVLVEDGAHRFFKEIGGPG